MEPKMSGMTERSLGRAFGLLGGLLLLLGGLLAFFLGAAELVTGRPYNAINASSEGVVLLVVGVIALMFSHLASHGWAGRPAMSGVMLIVVAFVAWLTLGFGGNVLALVGAILVFLAGALYLVSPALKAAGSLATA
ncbi:MAG: hypothetical protein L3K17_07395 [Thermoplasmata archaeon]|nr:hypothetical protein [Thermoplasmata archaeon]